MSQLHKRLDHLVNYSSQLIFVSSDSIADQQRTLTEFLSLQHETTEVSFFPADAEQDASDYRRIICRQLADHTVGSFVRPLKELLQDLEAEKGHYLVCISQAQHLDAKFLNELWDWVTSCRQQHDDLHINVILFAQQAWTEQAQTWLPTHHINKPVLLSSQSIDAVGFDVSALENLMAQKRAFFAADDTHNIIRNKWFILSVLSVFLVIFIALIGVQYPQQIRYFIDTGELPTTPSKEKATTLVTQSDEEISESEQSTMLTAPLRYEPQLEVVEPNITDSLLVSNWPPEQETQVNEQSTSAPDLDDASNPSESELELADVETLNEPAQDFAVDDIVSVQQLDQRLQQDVSDNAQSAPLEVLNTNTDDVYEFDETVLLTLSQNQILLQLSGIQNRNVLASYLSDNDLSDITWVYETQRYGGPWYVVLYKQSFNSINEATEAVSLLPLSAQQASPFAKRVLQVQQEILQR